MALLGTLPERAQEVREFFAELEPGEYRRLYFLFTEMMQKCPEHEQVDWSDKSPNGPRKAPIAMGASNGKR